MRYFHVEAIASGELVEAGFGVLALLNLLVRVSQARGRDRMS